MNRHAQAALAASLTLALVLIAGPTFADVTSTLATAGTAMKVWVRIGAIVVFIIMGLLIVSGFRNIVAMVAAVIGLAIAISPEQIVAWIS